MTAKETVPVANRDRSRTDHHNDSPPSVSVAGVATRKYAADAPPKARDQIAWDDPILPNAHKAHRPFPVEAFPELARDYIRALATSLQVDTAMAGTAVLTAMGAALVGRITVHSWEEEALIWTAIVAASGDGKSPVAKRVDRKLLAGIEDIVRDVDPAPQGLAREAAEQKHGDAEREVKALEKRLATERAKDQGADQADIVAKVTAQLAEAREAERELRVPPTPRVLVDDMTPEALHKILAETGGRITAHIPEGTGLFHKLSGKDAANVAPWLAAADGDPIRATRVTTERADVPAARMTLGMYIQPEVLAEGIGTGALSYNGFKNRFLYTAPRSLAGTRVANPPMVDAFVESALVTRLREIAESLWLLEDPRNLPLSAGARERFDELYLKIDRDKADHGDEDPIREMTSKLMGKTLRISGVFAVIEDPEASEVSADVLRRAETVANYFHEQAAVMWGHQLTADGAEDRMATHMAKVVLRFRDEGEIRLSAFGKYGHQDLRTTYRAANRGHREAEAALGRLNGALARLKALHWISGAKAPYMVSPLLGDITAEDLG